MCDGAVKCAFLTFLLDEVTFLFSLTIANDWVVSGGVERVEVDRRFTGETAMCGRVVEKRKRLECDRHENTGYCSMELGKPNSKRAV